jgi:SAM-dependent methyltransferase
MKNQEAFSYSGYELDALQEARNYYSSITNAFRAYLGQRIVEVGAGTGTFANHLLNAAPGSWLTLIEPADNNFPILQRRFATNERVRLVKGYLSDAIGTNQADAIVAVNVLEHVDDHEGFVSQASEMLRDGGYLLIFVPALPVLFGSLDEQFEHYRRYTKSSLRNVLNRQGLGEVELRYTNLPGIASWFIAGRVLKKRTIGRREVQLYDRYIMPWVQRAEKIAPPPLGQSLIAVYRKGQAV